MHNVCIQVFTCYHCTRITLFQFFCKVSKLFENTFYLNTDYGVAVGIRVI